MRCLRRHLPDGLHHLHSRCRRRRAAHASARALDRQVAGPLYRRRAQDRPYHGERRRRLPALRAVRRALPDRRMGHEEILSRDDSRRPRMPIQSVNDFVIRFANVNGSGSASANELFARAIMRMGVPVSPRNIFPSNIQGLPTWYEVRVTEAGHLGRRGGVDLMVAMNPQTWDKDVAEIEPGGYLFYDSTRVLPQSKFRPDINVVGMPLTAIVNERYSDPRQRQLFKNIIYVGALASLLGIEIAEVEKLVAEQFRGKDKLIPPNYEALHMGRDYAETHLEGAVGLKVRRADAVGDRIFLEGNDASGLGAVYGGATVCAWYPITPSTSLAEAFTKHCGRFRTEPDGKQRFAIIQAEDELASIGM